MLFLLLLYLGNAHLLIRSSCTNPPIFLYSVRCSSLPLLPLPSATILPPSPSPALHNRRRWTRRLCSLHYRSLVLETYINAIGAPNHSASSLVLYETFPSLFPSSLLSSQPLPRRRYLPHGSPAPPLRPGLARLIWLPGIGAVFESFSRIYIHLPRPPIRQAKQGPESCSFCVGSSEAGG